MVDPPCPKSTTAESDRKLGPASPQLLPGGTLRGFFVHWHSFSSILWNFEPQTSKLHFWCPMKPKNFLTPNLNLPWRNLEPFPLILSVLPWDTAASATSGRTGSCRAAELLKTCSCADHQSDCEMCALKIRLNSSCLNKNLSKRLESEQSQFLSVKPQFYSQESFSLWNRVMLISRGSIQRQMWGLTPSRGLCPPRNRQFNLLDLLRTCLSLCLLCSPFSGSHPSFRHFAFRGSFLCITEK